MNKIVITQYKGTIQHARLLTVGFGDLWDEQHRQPVAYISGMDYQWFDYVSLQDIPAFWAWYENLTRFPTGELCLVAKANVARNFLKGWAAMTLLTEDVTMLTSKELIVAIEAADRHTATLIGRNALEILQEESDRRELGG